MNTHTSRLPALVRIPLLDQWSFRELGHSRWLSASVPGCVHTDLLAHELIEDPFYGSNEASVQWIEYRDWEYQTQFELSEEVRAHTNIRLVCEGLDTYADIYIDDQHMQVCDNMYRSWAVSLNGLSAGTHSLRIVFRSPINQVLPDMAKLTFRYHAVQDNDVEASPMTRKAPFHYGWDWGPRLVTAGIWRPIYLEAWSEVKVLQSWIRTLKLAPQQASLCLTINLEATKAHEIEVSLVHCTTGKGLLSQQLTIVEGLSTHEFALDMEDPQLWWPNGMGESFLHEFDLILMRGSVPFAHEHIRTGIRTIELKREPDQWGESFTFVVNGQDVFIKGANWIPADSFVQRITPAHYRYLIESAQTAHFNMLRVWGGGIYETDTFFELCDELGILVWQDFMFSCSLFPGDEDFLENVRMEAEEQVKRLRPYTSLALWCGNNENEWIYDFEGGGMKQRFGIPAEEIPPYQAAYEALYDKVLPEAVAAHDPSRSYWPSSPSSMQLAPPNDEGYGDIHHWDVWHMGHPVENYLQLQPRFISEFGFQAMPDSQTVREYLPDNERFIGAPSLQTHQKHPRGFQLIRTYMERAYQAPKDFDAFIYLSQIQQADYLKLAIEHFRALQARCMGILYWQYNDCWPVCSWSTIDHAGRWKAAHYYARQFYAPYLIYLQHATNGVKPRLVCDQTLAAATLHWELKRFDGAIIEQGSLALSALDQGVHELDLWELTDNPEAHPHTNNYVHARLTHEGALLTQNRLFFCPIKALDLPQAAIQSTIEHQGDHVIITLYSPVFAKNVYIQSIDHEGFFSDNYFDVDPGQSVEVICHAKTSAVPSAFKITSMVEQLA